MLFRFGYDITVLFDQPTPMVCLLSTRKEHAGDLYSPEQIITNPPVATRTYTDMFGNTCLRFEAPAGAFTLWGDATIRDSGLPDEIAPDAREVPIAEVPDDCLVYLMGSRYCETDELSQQAWNMFGSVKPGWTRVQAICDFVHNHIAFNYLDARDTRGAHDAFLERKGVCRDFAHLALTLCRCMNIPARYVNGFISDIGVPILTPADFCAWIEVYLEGRWWTFDPRNNVPRVGRIVVARGRDAADVPLMNSFGPHLLQSFRVWTYEVSPEEAAEAARLQTQAV